MILKDFYHNRVDRLIHWLTHEPLPHDAPPCDFNRLKYELRPGDVLLVEGLSKISNYIRSFTHSTWTHSALYIGKLHDIEDPELKKTVALSMQKRENVRLIIEGVLGKGIIVAPLSSYRHHHIRICRPIGLTPMDAERVVAYAIKALGQPYNVRQFLDLARYLLPWSILPRRWGSSLFRTPTGEPESGICSTLIAEAFTSVKFPILPFLKIDETHTGVELIQRNPYLFTPKDFDYSPYFEIIKYPLFDPNEPLPYYRRLPWAATGVMHQDEGIVTTPKKIKSSKGFLPNLLSGTKKTKKKVEEPDDNITKPETD